MATLAERMAERAVDLIAKFGRELTLRRREVDTAYNPATGTEDVIGRDYMVTGVLGAPTYAQLSAGVALANDATVMLAVNAAPVVPEIGDQLLLEERWHSVVGIRNDSDAVYNLIVRSE